MQCQEKKQSTKWDSDLSHIVELSESEFQISMMIMLKALVEKDGAHTSADEKFQ